MSNSSSKFIASVNLLRPAQWTKNLFVFLPIFFSGDFFVISLLWPTIIAFISFCLISSSIYCLNDICDQEADKKHPIKCQRPIAAGQIGERTGYFLMVVTLAMGLGILLLLPKSVFWSILAIIALQYLLMVAYCLWLKKIEIVDVTVISIGFVIRVIVGSIASESFLSHWIVLMTFLLALILALSKRRVGQARNLESTPEIYNPKIAFVDNIMIMISAVTILCYIMYTLAVEVQGRLNTSLLYITSIFVILGIWRYLKVIMLDHCILGPTRILLRDRFLQCCILLWGVSYFILLYIL